MFNGIYIAFTGIYGTGTYFAVGWYINAAVYWFWWICTVMWGWYVDYSRSAVKHIHAIWQAYVLRGICQWCHMYEHQWYWSNYWLHWVQMGFIHLYSCLIYAYELIGICTIAMILMGIFVVGRYMVIAW